MFTFTIIFGIFLAIGTVALSIFAEAEGTTRMWPFAWPRLAVAAITIVCAVAGRRAGLDAWFGLALLFIVGIGLLALATRQRLIEDYPSTWDGLFSADPIGTAFGGIAVVLTLILLVIWALPLTAAPVAPGG